MIESGKWPGWPGEARRDCRLRLRPLGSGEGAAAGTLTAMGGKNSGLRGIGGYNAVAVWLLAKAAGMGRLGRERQRKGRE